MSQSDDNIIYLKVLGTFMVWEFTCMIGNLIGGEAEDRERIYIYIYAYTINN